MHGRIIRIDGSQFIMIFEIIKLFAGHTPIYTDNSNFSIFEVLLADDLDRFLIMNDWMHTVSLSDQSIRGRWIFRDNIAEIHFVAQDRRAGSHLTEDSDAFRDLIRGKIFHNNTGCSYGFLI